jgi:peroxiredoxin
LRLHVILLLILIVFTSIEVLAEPKEGSKIPEFTLTVVGADGKNCTIKSSSLTGRTVLIVFYAYWCPHCNKELPELAAAWNQCSRGGDIAILAGLGGNSTRDYDLFKKYAANGWYFLSENYTFAKLFGIEYIPVVLIVDGNGIIKQVNVGEAGRGKYCIGMNLAHSTSGQSGTNIPCEQQPQQQLQSWQLPILVEIAVVLVMIAFVIIAVLIRMKGKS